MNKRSINLEFLEDYGNIGEIIFLKPVGSKLHRVCSIPEKYTYDAESYEELIDLLDMYCKIKKDGVYYFLFESDSQKEMLLEKIFLATNIICHSSEWQDEIGRDKHGFLLPEFYN